MRIRRAVVAAAVALGTTAALLAPSTSVTAASWKSRGDGLTAGAFVQFRQQVPVNVVLVGYDKSRVGGGLRSVLPRSSTPLVRYPQFYGLDGRNLGLTFDYRYNVIDTPKSFEDAFFRHLRTTGTVTDSTLFQQEYNAQQGNVRDVADSILTIDAASTERYLQTQAQRRLGVDTRRGYTVFLVNWWGRKDFRDHVYRATTDPDPDTGVNLGAERESRAMIAWGGSSGRTWFYDLSAGPEAWSNNWNVDDADLDGNGVADYRMPPSWEYRKGGYRAPSELGKDLGRVVRFVAINLLFTTSPLYDPMVTTPAPGGKKSVQIQMFDDDPDTRGADWIKPAESRAEWSALEPYHRFATSLTERGALDGAMGDAFDITNGNIAAGGCWEDYGDPFAQLFCQAEADRDLYIVDDPKNYEQGVFAFNTTDERMGANFGLLGYADDNWVDGTQSYVFEFEYPDVRAAGFGFTTTTTHEVGHHLGMSHPHDGYDSTLGIDYGAADEFQFVWSGDESASIMSYLGNENGFGQFDKDNMARYQFAGYLNWANSMLGDVDGKPLTAGQRAKLDGADALARLARSQFRNWNYLGAASSARQAWALVYSVADAYGVAELASSADRRIPGSRVVPEIDRIRFPDDRPVVR
jgi:hypothetical protein